MTSAGRSRVSRPSTASRGCLPPPLGMGASGPTSFPSPAALRFTGNGASGEAGAPAETRQLRACPASGPLIRPRVTATAVGRVGSAPGTMKTPAALRDPSADYWLLRPSRSGCRAALCEENPALRKDPQLSRASRGRPQREIAATLDSPMPPKQGRALDFRRDLFRIRGLSAKPDCGPEAVGVAAAARGNAAEARLGAASCGVAAAVGRGSRVEFAGAGSAKNGDAARGEAAGMGLGSASVKLADQPGHGGKQRNGRRRVTAKPG